MVCMGTSHPHVFYGRLYLPLNFILCEIVPNWHYIKISESIGTQIVTNRPFFNLVYCGTTSIHLCYPKQVVETTADLAFGSNYEGFRKVQDSSYTTKTEPDH